MLDRLNNTQSALSGGAPAADGAEGEYYFVTRWMRLENAALLAPERSDVPQAGDPEDPEADTAATADAVAGAGAINMIFGRENIRVYLALDLVRFIQNKNA